MHEPPGSFLLSTEWCLAWPNCVQVAKMRGLSDHCPLVLFSNEEDWGPRPSRMLKCWKDISSYNLFVKDKWNSFQNLPSRIESLKGRLSDIDQKGEEEQLSEADESLAGECHFVHSGGGVTIEGVNSIRLNLLESSSLIIPFSAAEVKAAVWDCDSYKSLSPDGINFGFIKDFWDVLQGDVMHFILEFYRNGKLTKGLNSTFIALIPKIESPQRLNDFRPISLVGCLYKILAKVLANRLRLVIGSVIYKSQIAFVKDIQILDGILIENEVVDEAHKCKKELMLFKRKWIKECISTATTSILVNGSPTDKFPLERGLRQGDPLYPFLFLVAAEGLHVMMKTMVERNIFIGYRVGESDSISHLQFADDTLLLGEKSWANVRALGAVLVLFETMSGLKVNFNKSLPIGGDPRRLGFWEPLLARLKNRLSGWKSRLLSFGGRLILLKFVLTYLPVYALSFFKAPLGVWRFGEWCWRMLVDREGLWFRVLEARFGVERGSLRVGGRKGFLWWREIASIRDGGGGIGGGWFREHVSKKVGDGSDTFFWTDPWVDEIPLCERFGRLFDLARTKSISVAEMFALGWVAGGEAWVWRRQLRVWEEEMLRECQTLLSTLSLQVVFSDRWLWQPDPFLRGAYQLLTSHDSVTLDVAEDLIWHGQVPLKVSVLAWRLLRDRLPTKSNLVA
ncbi:hypothetical protein TSUD_177580 [Trifolium subterraneum]|uniref:Reverse transcriptase domain-containing protein n=1 Tax=Trifolium subterraneum TaxID=3900 RepID=A0A2Z6PDR7_TRISU|nr:hypothetical protein TSUD_177580 [Trifolium subterraneum]